MQARALWWLVAVVVLGAGIAAVVKIFSDREIGYGLPLALLATVVCAATALPGLALLYRGRLLAASGVLFLLVGVVTYVLIQVGTWHERFAEKHPRVIATAVIVTAFGALAGTLAASIRAASPPLRLVTVAAQTLIAAAAGYAISLVWTISEQRGPSRTQGRVLELLVVLAIVGWLTTPVVQRALRRGRRRRSPSGGWRPAPSAASSSSARASG